MKITELILEDELEKSTTECFLKESAVFLNPTTVIVGQAHGQPLELSSNTLKQIQDIAAKHGAWYEGNGTDRTYTRGQIDKYIGSWDNEVAKTASSNDPKWLYVLFANVDDNNRVQRVGVDPKDTIFNRLLATAEDNSFQGIGYTSQALQKFLQMSSEGKYDFVKMSQQPATQENLTRFLKSGESLMWPSNWEQYPNKAGKIAKMATVDVRDQYLATRKAGVYVTGDGHLKAVQNITGKQNIAEEQLDEWSHTDSDIRQELEEKGYEFLDSGVDQSAYIEPGTGWILKIFGTQKSAKFKGSPQFSQDHKMFFKWAKFCMDNSDNPFLPHFDDYDSFKWRGQTYLQIRQEPLTSAKQISGLLAEISESIGSETSSWKEFSQSKSYYKKILADKLIKLLGSEQKAMLFYNTVLSLFLTGNKHGWTWDLHGGNFMMRGKTPVIADPWVIN